MTSTRTPQVSVVIPTYRRESLAAALSGLATQRSDLSFEVVVVDNDAAGSAEPIVRAHADRIGALVVRHIVEPRSGSAYARNRGIAEAQAPIIALLDDDVIPQVGWLAAIVAPILDGTADATGGRVILDPEVPRPKWVDDAEIGGYLSSFHLGDSQRELTQQEYVITANAAFSTELLRRSGGFDPVLGPRGRVSIVGDDVHVVRAVRGLGGRIWYVPGAVVVHQLPMSRLRPLWLLRRAWWQGRSDWLLDAETLGARRLGGARVALEWCSRELARRRKQGLTSPPVLFHALCDLSRTGGSLWGAASLSRRNRRSTARAH